MHDFELCSYFLLYTTLPKGFSSPPVVVNMQQLKLDRTVEAAASSTPALPEPAAALPSNAGQRAQPKRGGGAKRKHECANIHFISK